MTWWPSGAREGSRSEGTETTMTLPGLSMGTSQLLTTVHCGGRSAGMHSAFTPRCRCMKLLHSGSPVPVFGPTSSLYTRAAGAQGAAALEAHPRGAALLDEDLLHVGRG